MTCKAQNILKSHLALINFILTPKVGGLRIL